MGFSHLLRTEVALANFRARFVIPVDVDAEYSHEGSIENDRHPHVVLFPLMAIFVNSSSNGIESEDSGEEMVVRRNVRTYVFLML